VKANVTEEAVLQALRAVQDPDLHRDIVSLGFVKDLRIRGGDVAFSVELTTPACPVKEDLRRRSHDVVAALPGVKKVDVRMTANVRAGASAPDAGGPRPGAALPGVRNVIAVGAGKGGVGKSTVAVNLALALRARGARVGLLDADVFGPSLPKMMGTEGQRLTGEENRLHPVEAHGIATVSIGYVLDPAKPMVVRGPIVHRLVGQFLGDVEWGQLDYLVVDLPPGTGDVSLSLAQTVPITGAVVVSTPQDVSLIDVQKAVSMFRTLRTPVLGLVENMSHYACPACGHRDDVFGHAGAEAWARENDIPFLGAIPLHARVRVGGDAGRPAVVDEAAPEAVRAAFGHVAEEVARRVSIQAMARPSQPLIQIQGL
jgi:ATP-binding protein involved in chromosome partitioning